MAQPFDCLCGTPTCRGRIAGARDMTLAQLDSLWLNGHIRAQFEERENGQKKEKRPMNGTNGTNGTTVTNGHTHPKTNEAVFALRNALTHAENAAAALRRALVLYDPHSDVHGAPAGAQRRGPTSRELSGEMGGDTTVRI